MVSYIRTTQWTRYLHSWLFFTDCDPKYLRAMRLSQRFPPKAYFHNRSSIFRISVSLMRSWIFTKTQQLYVCLQDLIHLCTKLCNRLLTASNKLFFGNELTNIDILLQFIIRLWIIISNLCQKDRQNYSSCIKTHAVKKVKLTRCNKCPFSII